MDPNAAVDKRMKITLYVTLSIMSKYLVRQRRSNELCQLHPANFAICMIQWQLTRTSLDALKTDCSSDGLHRVAFHRSNHCL